MIIHSKIKDYSVEMMNFVLQNRDRIFSSFQYNRLFYFIDENVYAIYKNDLESFIRGEYYCVIPANEKNKDYLSLAEYYRNLIERRFIKRDILVTLGGGILQDISGFIASTLYRGIRWIFFPTTLLAQADSCIGSKTSINFDDSKNLIGSFYPPDAIFIDVTFCETLTPEYFNSGLGEIIKFHLMADIKKFNLLKQYLSSQNLRSKENLEPVIRSTLEIKKSYFEGDEFDADRRNLLNYGHCFGHALESASNFAVSHGEAVLVGMGFANLLSLKRAIIKKRKYDEFESIFQKYYPRFDLSTISIDILVDYLKRDKKRDSKDLTMILAEDIGKYHKYNDIKESEIKEVYGEFLKIFPNV